MSVDYYGCDYCGESVYEYFVHECSKCGWNICENCFNKDKETPPFIYNKEDVTEEQYKYLCDKYGKNIIDNNVIDWEGLNPEYCPFCSGNKVHDNDLLHFALSLLSTTKEQLTKDYLKIKNK